MCKIITGSFQDMNNERLLKSGITNQQFMVIENMKESFFNELKTGDKISFMFNNKEYSGIVEYKYRDKKDVKVKLDEI